MANCLRITRRQPRYLHRQGRWASFLYSGRLDALLYCYLARLFCQNRSFFFLGSQTIIFMLQVLSAFLQFLHLSRLLLLFLIHILMPMKKLIFRRLDHWVASHCICIKQIRYRNGSHWITGLLVIAPISYESDAVMGIVEATGGGGLVDSCWS